MDYKYISMRILWIYFLSQHCVAGPQTISCSGVTSPLSGGSDDAQTTVSCPANTITVSCGAVTKSASATIDGAYYDETNNQCVAQNGIGSPEGVWATARCCSFDISVSCNNVAGGFVFGTSTASCNSGQQLTGCNGYSPWNKVGAYPGDAASSRPDLISDFSINYETTNVCTAYNGGGKLRADGICCTSSSQHDYTLQCITRYGVGGTSHSQTSCPANYAMIGCSGYGPSGNTNAWYIENNICYSRSSNSENTWAVARCCIVDRPYSGYKAGPSVATYSAAKAYCNSIGETLAIVRNEDENDAVSRLCDNVDGDKTKGCWIGLSKNNDKFEWQDGSNYLLQNINAPIFTNFNDECIAVPPEDSMNLKWKSYPCSDAKYPICDYYTLAPTPSPTSCTYQTFCLSSCLPKDEYYGDCDCGHVVAPSCRKTKCRRQICTTANIEPYLEPYSEPKHVHYFSNINVYMVLMALIILNFVCCGLWILRKQCKNYKKSKVINYQFDVETESN